MATFNYVSKANITAIVEQMKTYIDSDKTLAIKNVKAVGNGIAFYNVVTPADGTAPTFKIDFPTEYFLDQAKTTFVDNFVFSAETYVGATDPTLDGKPVFVLAVKGDDNTVTYSFVNLEKLIPDAVDISGKADKLVNPEDGDAVIKAGQILVDDGNGNLGASGKTIEEVKAEIEADFQPMTEDEVAALFA